MFFLITQPESNERTNKSHIMNQSKSSDNSSTTKPTSTVPEWITETINGGSSPVVDLETGTNGWATPPGDAFSIRSAKYFKNKQKSPGGDYLLLPAGVDWLKSAKKLDNILSRPDNRVTHALKKAQSQGKSLNAFIFAINFQIPWKDQYSLVYYFATEEPIPSNSLLYKFINEDDTYRNQRLKCVSQVVKGPRVVKAGAGSFGAFVISKAVTCNYHKGSNYFEVDIDLRSSKIMTAFLRLTFGFVTSLAVDVGILVEAQTEDELPERLIGAVRMRGMELSSAFVVDDDDDDDDDKVKKKSGDECRLMGVAKAKDEEDKV